MAEKKITVEIDGGRTFDVEPTGERDLATEARSMRRGEARPLRSGTGVVAVTVLMSLPPSSALAQDVSSPVRMFVTAGAGFGSHFTPHASLTASHRTGDYILRGAMAYGADLGGYSPWGGPREVTEIAALYGRRVRWSRGWVRAAVGGGYVYGDQLEPVAPGEEPTTSSVGLAGQVGFVWTPARSFGVGLTGVGNVNGFRSLGAVTLSVHVGRVG